MIQPTERVLFIEDTHEYILDGDRHLMGVTQLMKKHGLSANYDGIPQAVLDKAASLGTQAHTEIENYIDGLPVANGTLIKSFKKLGILNSGCATEFLVSDHKMIASSIDIIQEVGENVYDLYDIKRNDRLHTDALSWQLGIYKYLIELNYPDAKVRNCYCLPVKKGNKDDILADTCQAPVQITPVTKAEVEELLRCEESGESYDLGLPAPEHSIELALKEEEIADYTDAVAYLANLDLQAKEAKAIVERFNGVLYDYMLENDIDELTCPEGKVKLKRPYSTTRLDSAALKKKYPAIAEECSKTSEVKGSVSFKFNE